MLKTTSYKQLDQWFQKFSDETLADEWQVLRNQVSDNSKWEQNIDLTSLRLPDRAKRPYELIKLGILHWYFPEELRWLFRFWLEENWKGQFLEEKEVILTSKEMALGYLLIQSKWSDRDLWGNVLTKKFLLWFKCKGKNPPVRFKSKTGKVKRTVRHRGYRDKGSKRPDHLSVLVDISRLRTEEEQELAEVEFRIRVNQLINQIQLELSRQVS